MNVLNYIVLVNLCILYSVKDFLCRLLICRKNKIYFFSNPQPHPCTYVVIVFYVEVDWNKRRFELFILSIRRLLGGDERISYKYSLMKILIKKEIEVLIIYFR